MIGAWRTYTALALLYLGQGMPMGIAFEALPALLREQGFPPQHIGLVGLALLPWALRLLWAPLVERWTAGRQTVWIAGAHIATLLVYGAIALRGGAGWFALGAVILASFVTATQNTLTDGYAVRALRHDRLGRINGLQVGGFALGMLAGGGLMLVVHGIAGGAAVWLLPAAIAAAALPFLSALPAEPQGRGGRAAGFARFVARPGAVAMLAVAATFYLGRALVGDLMSVVLFDHGMAMGTVGLIRSASTAAMAVGGIVAGAALIDRWGAPIIAPVAGACWALALLGWAIMIGMKGGVLPALLLSIADGLAGGATYAAVLAVFMRWASPQQAGTDVTVLMCTESISNMGAAMLGGVAAASIGFAPTFAFAALVMGAAMIGVRRVSRKSGMRETRHAVI